MGNVGGDMRQKAYQGEKGETWIKKNLRLADIA